MNYAIEQRMRTIDFLLAHFGYAARRHLVDFYGLSKPQASLDFATYNDLNPGAMVLDGHARCWIATESFTRLYP